MNDEKIQVIESEEIRFLLEKALPIIDQLIRKSRFKRMMGDNSDRVLLVGLEWIDPAQVDAVLDRLVAELPAGEDLVRVQRSVEQWKEHRDEIIADNRMTSES